MRITCHSTGECILRNYRLFYGCFLYLPMATKMTAWHVVVYSWVAQTLSVSLTLFSWHQMHTHLYFKKQSAYYCLSHGLNGHDILFLAIAPVSKYFFDSICLWLTFELCFIYSKRHIFIHCLALKSGCLLIDGMPVSLAIFILNADKLHHCFMIGGVSDLLEEA